MSDSHSQSQRIETLELKLMDLENSLQELNDVVLRQYRDIENLQQANKILELRLANSSEGSTPLPTAADEVPPHY